MKQDKHTPGGANQRVCERLKVSRTALLELETGDILMGRTLDISPRGVLMEPDAAPVAGLSGKAGTLYIISDEGRFSIGYPCKVVRLDAGGVALEIHKNAAAAFGSYMAAELLGVVS